MLPKQVGAWTKASKQGVLRTGSIDPHKNRIEQRLVDPSVLRLAVSDSVVTVMAVNEDGI